MPTLRVTLLQTDLAWQAPAVNMAQLQPQLLALSGKTDLVVLPEMFSTGFIDQPWSITKVHELDQVLPWLQSMAQTTKSAIYTSSPFYCSTKGWVNRGWFVSPEGDFHYYDKAHLFCLGREAKDYSAGNRRTLIRYNGWTLLLTICYDLRFPSFCRNSQHAQGYDVMLCVANWPKARRHAWKALLTARALENQAYVIGVNRTGTDGKGLSYSGDSRLLDFNGKLLLDAHDQNDCLTTVIDTGSLKQFRQAYPFLEDADHCALPKLNHQLIQLG